MRIVSLHIYPVKSCGSLAPQQARLGELGLEGDRRYAVVDLSGRALSQRRFPVMATIQPTVQPDSLVLDLGGLDAVEAPDGGFDAECEVEVWGHRFPARAAASVVNDRISAYLGAAARLVLLGQGARQSFADSRPVLVVSIASLTALNAALGRALGIERFRGNIVVDGATPRAELGWRRLAAGAAELEFDSGCERCEVTTIDQASGGRGGDEPLRTITARFDSVFGAYFRVSRPGLVAVGATLVPG